MLAIEVFIVVGIIVGTLGGGAITVDCDDAARVTFPGPSFLTRDTLFSPFIVTEEISMFKKLATTCFAAC